MKVEKLNQNTLKIILSIEELSVKNITIKDIENGKKKAQNFFFDIIEESKYADDFLKNNNKLLVEAAVSQDNTLIVTITKVDDLPDIPTSQYPKKHQYKIPTSTLYIFNSLTDLNKFIYQVKSNNLYIGTNNLYKYNNIYFLTFPLSVVKNIKFKQTYYTLTEYCTKHLSKPYNICKLTELSSLVIPKNAIKFISSHILE